MKNFIIAGYSNKIKSYDYTTNKIYQTYFNSYRTFNFYDIIINNDNDLIKLITSSGDSYIRIWDFDSAKILSKILINDRKIYTKY